MGSAFVVGVDSVGLVDEFAFLTIFVLCTVFTLGHI